jgi:hypothetical protein
MEYLEIYLLGSATVAVLSILKYLYFNAIAWIFKVHVINKNLAKISLDSQLTFWEKLGTFGVALFFESLLSWINVPIICWQFFHETIKVLRESISTVPEDIKILRYPLKNNPNLEAEIVWAYSQALNFKNGTVFSSLDLANSLVELKNKNKYFQSNKAINSLKSLAVYPTDVVDEIEIRLRSESEEITF